MVSVAEAERIILSHPFQPMTRKVPLLFSTGKVLAEPIFADRDLPPFDRATMDGIAYAFAGTKSDFTIEGVCAAGQPLRQLTSPNHCFEIMTGAPLPQGADTVVPYEQVTIEGNLARVNTLPIKGQNIHRQGADAKSKEALLHKHLRISPAEISLLASVGRSDVMVNEVPSVALLSTGDELIDIDQTPLPHQIRKSNTHALQAALVQQGVKSVLFHVNDDEQLVKATLRKILTAFEIIIMSGGVSKGKFDFVPGALDELGVEKLFHNVSQRPGKPMWFGRSEKNVVFALPGNPVSTFLCFYRYVKPWIEKSLGLETNPIHVILAQDFKFAPPLTYFLQVKIKNESGMLMAYPVAGGGSGDFANLTDVDGFLELPSAQTEFKAGGRYLFYPFR